MALLKTFLLILMFMIVNGCDKEITFDEYTKMGEDYASQGKTEKAIEAYKKAVKIRSRDANAHYALGCLYFKELLEMNHQSASNSKDVEEQKEKRSNLTETMTKEYKQVLEIDPSNWNARYMIATELYNNQHYQESIEEYKKVIKNNPKYGVAYSMLARSYLATGLNDLAIENINKMQEQAPDKEFYYYRLGQAYYFMKEDTKGFEMETKLKAMNSTYYNNLLDYRFSYPRSP